MKITLLDWFILASAILHIGAEYRGPQVLVYIFKPLTTLLIFLTAITIADQVSTFYQSLICIGLLFSLGGDILLMLPADRFVPGLVSFLLAHLCYIAAFGSVTGVRLSMWKGLIFLIYAVIIYAILSPFLGKLRFPVIAYMIVILTMAWLS